MGTTARWIRTRTATPERWAKAAGRAIEEGVEVRQIASTGQWIATSGTQSNACYLLDVVAGVVRGCTCPAGELGDPVCKHGAAFYLAAGVMDPEPPTPAAPALRIVPRHCPDCAGHGYVRKASALFGTTYGVDCRACGGSAAPGEGVPAPIAA